MLFHELIRPSIKYVGIRLSFNSLNDIRREAGSRETTRFFRQLLGSVVKLLATIPNTFNS